MALVLDRVGRRKFLKNFGEWYCIGNYQPIYFKRQHNVDANHNPEQNETTMTAAQKSYIESLTRQLGLGRFADDGIKAVLGKKPINMTQAKASEVIDELKKRIAK